MSQDRDGIKELEWFCLVPCLSGPCTLGWELDW